MSNSKQRFIVARDVGEAEFRDYATRMGELGLDPVFDKAPLEFSVPPQPLQGREERSSSKQFIDSMEGQPHIPESCMQETGGENGGQGSRKINPFARMERQLKNLHNLTIGEKINERRHENALQRWEWMKKDWERFRRIAAKKTNRPKAALTITGAEEYREKMELVELIDHVTPEFIKSGGFGWYQSLRDYGARLVTIGNLFSGLYLFIKLNKDYSEEIIRKPWLQELVYYRQQRNMKTWRENPYLVARQKRYNHLMQEVAPGRLEYDEILEVEGRGYNRILDKNNPPFAGDAGGEGAGAMATQMGAGHDAQSQPKKIVGPKLDVYPPRLEFHCESGKHDSLYIMLKNTGTTVMFWELEELPPLKHYEESVCPLDPTRRFTVHTVKGMIMPNAHTYVHVTFASHTAGNFTARWQIHTNPYMALEEYEMFGIAWYQHPDYTVLFKEETRRLQVNDWCVEFMRDIFGSVKVTPYPEKPGIPQCINSITDEKELERIEKQLSITFEERNCKKYYKRDYHRALCKFVAKLREFMKTLGKSAVPRYINSKGVIIKEKREHKHYTASDHAKARGHLPTTYPLQELPHVEGPEFEWDQRCIQLETLMNDCVVDPENENYPTFRSLRSDFKRVVRALSTRPLENSPVYPVMKPEVNKLVDLIIGEWIPVKNALIEANIDPAADPEDPDRLKQAQATLDPTVIEEKKNEFCDAFSMLTERFINLPPAEEGGEAPDPIPYVPSILTPNLELRMEDATRREVHADVVSRSLKTCVEEYRKKNNTETVDSGGQVVYYELDLAPCCTVEATTQTRTKTNEEGEEIEEQYMTYTLNADPEELAKRCGAGLNDIIGGNPKALFIGGHIDSLTIPGKLQAFEPPSLPKEEGAEGEEAAPPADDEEGAEGGGEAAEHPVGPVCATRRDFGTVPDVVSFEPLASVLEGVLNFSVQFVTFEQVSDPAFQAEIRKETEEEELKVVYLVENMSGRHEELGQVKCMMDNPADVSVVGDLMKAARLASSSEPSVAATAAEGEEEPSTKLRVEKLTWTEKECSMDRTFGFFFDVLIQDSFDTLLKNYTTSHYLSWGKKGLPMRIVGPYIDNELQTFFGDVLKMPADPTAEESPAAPADGEGEEQNNAPEMMIVGGGMPKEDWNAVVQKLSMTSNLTKLAPVVYLGGRLAMYILRYVFQQKFDEKEFPENPPLSKFLTEMLAELLLKTEELFLPVDFVLKGGPVDEVEPPVDGEEPPPKGPEETHYVLNPRRCRSEIFTCGKFEGQQLCLNSAGHIMWHDGSGDAADAQRVHEMMQPVPVVDEEGNTVQDEEGNEQFSDPDPEAVLAAFEAEQNDEYITWFKRFYEEVIKPDIDYIPSDNFTGAYDELFGKTISYIKPVPPPSEEEGAAPPAPYRFISVGPRSCELLKSRLSQVKSCYVEGSLGVQRNAPHVYVAKDGSKATIIPTICAPSCVKVEDLAKADTELYDFIEFRMQPIEDDEEEEEEEAEEDEDEEGNASPKEPKPKKKRFADFELSVFIGDPLITNIKKYKPTNSYTALVNGGEFLTTFLSGACIPSLNAIDDKLPKPAAS